MKAEVDALVMADAVKAAASVARGAGVTNCLRLEVVGTNMLVLGGDGDTFIELVVPVSGGEDGVLVTPAKTLAKAAPLLDGPVSLYTQGERLVVETMTSELSLPLADPVEYPRLRWPEGEPVELGAAWERLRLIAYASAMSSEPVFQAVKLLPDGWAEAYDKTRMARTPIPDGLAAAVRKDSFDFAAKVMGAEISAVTGENAVSFHGPGVRVLAATVQAQLATATPGELSGWLDEGPSFTCDRKAFLEAVSLVEVVRDGRAQPVRVDVVDEEATLSAKTPDVGEVSASFPVEGEMPWPFGITAGYVRDVLSRSAAERVTFQFGPSDRHPIVVETDDIVHMFGPNRAAMK